MKRHLGFVQKIFLQLTPVIATFAFTSPSVAATLAFSEGNLNFTNFSKNLTIARFNAGDTFAVTDGGFVTIDNNGLTNFIPEPPSAFTFGSSLLRGESKDYLGFAETTGKILGNFDVDAGELFNFDFTASLNLFAGIDNTRNKSSRAKGDISFLLFDTTNIAQVNEPDFFSNLLAHNKSFFKNPLEFFSLNGSINTANSDDFLNTRGSTNVTFDNNPNFSFGSQQEFVDTKINGSLQRLFNQKTNLTLIAVRQGEAKVTASEPSNMATILLFALVIVALGKSRMGSRE